MSVSLHNVPSFNTEELDLLADIISSSHEGTLYKRGWYKGKWGLRFDAHNAGFHIVTAGKVLLVLDSGAIYSLTEGDVVLLSEAHILLSDKHVKIKPFSNAALAEIEVQEGKGDVCMLCGAYLLTDARYHPVFSKIPPLILMRAGDRDPSVDAMVDLLDREFKANAPGARTIATRLIDALLVQILRFWIERDCPTGLNWLRALRIPTLSRALSLIHKQYRRNWTIDSLARAAGTSRCTLARRFSKEVGTSPIQFLTERRLNVAKALLESGNLSLDEIASQVGYASAFSLSKAFKREFGLAPTYFRENRP